MPNIEASIRFLDRPQDQGPSRILVDHSGFRGPDQHPDFVDVLKLVGSDTERGLGVIGVISFDVVQVESTGNEPSEFVELILDTDLLDSEQKPKARLSSKKSELEDEELEGEELRLRDLELESSRVERLQLVASWICLEAHRAMLQDENPSYLGLIIDRSTQIGTMPLQSVNYAGVLSL